MAAPATVTSHPSGSEPVAPQAREKRSKRGAAGVDKVRHRVAHNLVGLGEFAIDQLCNPGNPVVDVGGELRVTQADCRDHARGRRHAHNIDTCTR